jgi:hypothetical protein
LLPDAWFNKRCSITWLPARIHSAPNQYRTITTDKHTHVNLTHNQINNKLSPATDQVLRRWVITGEPRVQLQVTSCKIRCGWNDTTVHLPPSFMLSLITVTPSQLHFHIWPPSETYASLTKQPYHPIFTL